jgi:phage terminase small subunit
MISSIPDPANTVTEPQKATRAASQARRKGGGSPMRDSFAREYLKDFNATNAAVRAGYSPKTAGSQGHRLLKSPAVREALDEATAGTAKERELRVERVIEALAIIAFADPRDCFDHRGRFLPISQIPKNARRALASYKVRKFRSTGCRRNGKKHVGRRYTLRFSNKINALTMLGKYLGMFPSTGKGGKPPPRRVPREVPLEAGGGLPELSNSRLRDPLKPVPYKLGARPPARAGMKGRGSVMRDRFSNEYLKDLNATKAAIRAGYSAKTAASQGQRLLKSAAVREAIKEATARLRTMREVSPQRIIRELEMIVSFDPIEFYDNNWNPLPIDQMSIEARRSLASFEVRELCRCHRRNRTRIGPSHRIYDKLVASTVLAKILGIFP